MPLFSSYRPRIPRELFGTVCVLLTVVAACGPRAPMLTGAAAPYQPTVIASDVASRPGAMAWSPDGKRLAFLGRSVTIVDITGETPLPESIAVNAPRYVAWADDGTLSVLSRGQDQDVLVLVDPSRTGVIRKALDRPVDAVYPVERRRSLLLSQEAERLKFGTEVRTVISLLDLADGTVSTLYRTSRMAPAAAEDRDLMRAWTLAGPNPLDGSFLIIELVKPPALPLYSRVRTLDPASGDLAEIGSPDRRAIYTSAAWSPDGRRIALTGPGGRLQVRDLPGGALLDFAAPGLYPAWHPAGELLAVGGALVNVSTGETTPLLLNSGGSLAHWSPDGTRLAVIAGGKLLLFRDLGPAASPSARLDHDLKKKLDTLQDLLREDLITREEYRARRARLLSDRKGGPP